jgi:diguanylate cyclase (GGDEF)-like protein
MALIDVDHFKSYNDTYGHQAGDHALETIAAKLREQARRGDSLYRYGGEEFLCVFPEQTVVGGMTWVQRLRVDLQQMAIPHVDNPHGVLTFSAGVAMLEVGHTRTTTQVLKDADEALYRAKHLGRNRVECAAVHPPQVALR